MEEPTIDMHDMTGENTSRSVHIGVDAGTSPAKLSKIFSDSSLFDELHRQ